MKKYLSSFFVVFFAVVFFSYAPKANATIVSYARTPSGYYVSDPGTGVNVTFAFSVSSVPVGTTSYVITATETFGFSSTSCVSVSGSSFSGSPTIFWGAPNSIGSVYIEYFSGTCMTPLGIEYLEIGYPAFEIVASSCPAGFYSDDSCTLFMYYGFLIRLVINIMFSALLVGLLTKFLRKRNT